MEQQCHSWLARIGKKQLRKYKSLQVSEARRGKEKETEEETEEETEVEAVPALKLRSGSSECLAKGQVTE